MSMHPDTISKFPNPGSATGLRGVLSACAALLRGLIHRAYRLLPGRLSRTPSASGYSVTHMAGGRNDGPPDLDELWRDLNKRLSGMFNNKGGGNSPPPRGPDDSGGEPPAFRPDMKNAGLGLGLMGLVVLVLWAGSGFFIVQEGHQSVVTTFGRYSNTVDAGFQWRFPYPIQAHETVAVTQLRSVEVGRGKVAQATGLRESSMLTQDENIVDIRFTVQYRLKDSRLYLFENREPDLAVEQASESAVREIVGRSRVDSVLYEARDAIAADLVKSIQSQLDRLKAGILVVAVNLQNVQVPEQVQAAFNDAVKAGADRDRLKNEGQAYASDVIPKARGTAARLSEEASGYAQRVVAQAEGDGQRFKSVLAEYQKAPTVTRDRLYLDTMQQVYSNVTKIMVDSRGGNNLLYLPLDKLLQSGAGAAAAPAATAPAPAVTDGAGSAASVDVRSRDGSRSREREGR